MAGQAVERVLIVANDYPGQPWALPQVAAEGDAYERILAQGAVPFVTLRNETVAAFRAALAAQRPTAIIFCGHGDLEHAGGMALGFVSAQDGQRFDLVDHATMAGYLLTVPTLRLVLLDGCCTETLAKELSEGARRPGGGGGATLEHVICWRTKTEDRAAQVFGESFVQRCLGGGGETTAEAYESAKGAVSDLRVDDVLGTGHTADVINFKFEDPDTWVPQAGAKTRPAGIPLHLDLQASARAQPRVMVCTCSVASTSVHDLAGTSITAQ